MSPKPLYVSITNHGFGHATRATSVAATVKALCPEIPIVLATTAPHWLLSSYLEGPFIHHSVALDVGVLQRDSLMMDKSATLAKLQQIRQQSSALIQQEQAFLRQHQVGLVLADIPPLATAIAEAAEIPCWMMSNFGWDFIYRPWGGEFIAVADWIAGCFQRCDRLFRLPFHEDMAAFPEVMDVGLTGGTPRYDLAELRSRFAITTPPERTILLTFGGLGLQKIPYDTLDQFPDWQFISFDKNAPNLSNLRTITARHYRPVDFMPLCSRVVSKPGFSTFSEACRLGIPIVTLTREGFAEADLLLDGIQRYANHQILGVERFFEGDWSFLNEAILPPQQSDRLATNGNQTIARAVVDFLQTA
ncbi:MAG: glycosyl transferase [Cyanobacteria bacterium J06635_15]